MSFKPTCANGLWALQIEACLLSVCLSVQITGKKAQEKKLHKLGQKMDIDGQSSISKVERSPQGKKIIQKGFSGKNSSKNFLRPHRSLMVVT